MTITYNFHYRDFYISVDKWVCITWQGCYWVTLAEILDSSVDLSLYSLTLTPGCTSWQIWNSLSGFDPEQDRTEINIYKCFMLCINICLLTDLIWYHFDLYSNFYSNMYYAIKICFLETFIIRNTHSNDDFSIKY